MELRAMTVVPSVLLKRPWFQTTFAVRRMHAVCSTCPPRLFFGPRCTALLAVSTEPRSAATGQRSISWLAIVCTSPPVLAAQQAMQHFHDFAHLPWWMTIVLTTLAIRFLLTFPLVIYQNYVVSRYAKIQPEIVEIAKELKMETAVAVRKFGWDEKRAKAAFNSSLRKQIRLLIERDNCHPMKASLVLWIQIPAWFSVSFALRNLCSKMPDLDLELKYLNRKISRSRGPLSRDAHVRFLEMCEGGMLWIPNLTFPDTSLLFPVMFGLLNLAIVEIHSLRTLKHTRFQRILTNCIRGVAFVMIPISASVPSCLVLYWTTSSVLGLSQNLLLMSPRFRRLCRIPAIAGESSTPYQDLADNLRSRFRSNK